MMAGLYGTVLFLVILLAVGISVWIFSRIAGERRLVERRMSIRGNAREDARLLSMRFADLFERLVFRRLLRRLRSRADVSRAHLPPVRLGAR